jgi:mono/diheme cytochrome c family protein
MIKNITHLKLSNRKLKKTLIALVNDNIPMLKYFSVTILCFGLVRCSNKDDLSLLNIVNIDKKQAMKRWWHSHQQANNGSIIFSNHCAVCHGQDEQATNN